jgi:hypothetical protein
MTAYRAIAGLVGWAALALQYWLTIRGQAPAMAAERTVNFFCYFTVLTNLLTALALTAPLAAGGTAFGRWWLKPSVRAGVALYIAVVMAIYHLLLRQIWDPRGWQLVADLTLHYAMPILYLIDWLAFAPKTGLAWRTAVLWLAFPALYGVWTLIHGALSGWYPYPFLDVTALGYPRTFANMAGMVVAFLVPGLLVVALDRVLTRASSPLGSGRGSPAKPVGG